MKKFVILLIVFLLVFPLCTNAEPVISSEACIMLDAETGQVLYAKNADERMYPASITKLLTIYLALEKGKPDDVITASKNAIDSVPRDTSNIALDYGEKITVEDAISACILMSANDAANVLAEYISGSLDEFVKLMNVTANEMGVTNSNFVNANGLHDEAHYTTASDFAKITQASLQNENFVKYISNMEYTITPTNKKDESRNFVTQHRMLRLPQYADLNVIGGKSGYTSEALYTLVTYGEKNGHKLITVVLKSQTFTDLYKDTQSLLEYGYDGFTKIQIDSAKLEPHIVGNVTLVPKGNASFLINNKYNDSDLLYKYENEKLNISTPDGVVMATLDTEKIVEPSLFQKILKTILIIVLIIFALLVILIIWYLYVDNKKKKRRNQRKKLLYK